MTVLIGTLTHFSRLGANRLQSHSGIARAASQKKPDAAPTIAKAMS